MIHGTYDPSAPDSQIRQRSESGETARADVAIKLLVAGSGGLGIRQGAIAREYATPAATRSGGR